jgi:hypothetical protein
MLSSERTPNFLNTPHDEVISLPARRKSKSEKTPQINATECDSFGKLAQVSPTMHSRSGSIASAEEDEAINANPNAINSDIAKSLRLSMTSVMLKWIHTSAPPRPTQLAQPTTRLMKQEQHLRTNRNQIQSLQSNQA